MKFLSATTLARLVHNIRFPDKRDLEALFDEVKNSDFNSLRVQTVVTPIDADTDYVHGVMNLAGVQSIASNITSPDVPRIVTIKGGIAGQVGNVVIKGTNINDVAIRDTLALNGTDTIPSVAAFKTVTEIDLPVETHTSAAQVETVTGVGEVTNPGDASVIVTVTGMAGSPKTYACPVTNGLPVHWVPEVLAVLAADPVLTALYDVATGATADKITLTRTTHAANDASLNVNVSTGTATGITAEAASADTTAGVAYDTVIVGVANKFGASFPLSKAGSILSIFGTAAEASLPTFTLDATVEKSLIAPVGTPNGQKDFIFYYYL